MREEHSAGLAAGRALLVAGTLWLQGATLLAAEKYYDEPQLYGMRPNPSHEYHLGPIGVTGIETRIYKGMKVTVEKTVPLTAWRRVEGRSDGSTLFST